MWALESIEVSTHIFTELFLFFLKVAGLFILQQIRINKKCLGIYFYSRSEQQLMFLKISLIPSGHSEHMQGGRNTHTYLSVLKPARIHVGTQHEVAGLLHLKLKALNVSQKWWIMGLISHYGQKCVASCQ